MAGSTLSVDRYQVCSAVEADFCTSSVKSRIASSGVQGEPWVRNPGKNDSEIGMSFFPSYR
jgi:hypothetical protein